MDEEVEINNSEDIPENPSKGKEGCEDATKGYADEKEKRGN